MKEERLFHAVSERAQAEYELSIDSHHAPSHATFHFDMLQKHNTLIYMQYT